MAEEEIINQHNTTYIPVTKHRRQIIRMTVIFVIILLALVVTGVIFTARIYGGGRIALREAKNIRLAITAVDIEAYAAGRTVYAPELSNGLSKGTYERITQFADINGELRLTGYDKTSRTVTGMTYKKNRYLVTFSVDEKGAESWTVHYLFRIMDY